LARLDAWANYNKRSIAVACRGAQVYTVAGWRLQSISRTPKCVGDRRRGRCALDNPMQAHDKLISGATEKNLQ